MTQKIADCRLTMDNNGLEVGHEYLIWARGAVVLAIYTGPACPPGAHSAGSGRELPRFAPVRWLRGAPDDPTWPVYAGASASVKPIEISRESDSGNYKAVLSPKNLVQFMNIGR